MSVSQSVLWFLLELAVSLCLFVNVLHLAPASSRIRIFCAAVLTLLQCLCLICIGQVFLNAFVVWVLMILSFSGLWYCKLCWAIASSLALNILSNCLFYIFYLITGVYRPDFLEFGDLFGITVLISGSFWLKKKIPQENLLTSMSRSHYFLIIGIAFADFFLSMFSSLLPGNRAGQSGENVIILFIIIIIAVTIIILLLYLRLQHYHTILQQTNVLTNSCLCWKRSIFTIIRKKLRICGHFAMIITPTSWPCRRW